jgi:hypothetical protein
VLAEMCTASEVSMMSWLSVESVTRSAIRRLVLARMSLVTAPDGRCVARMRWMPSERPRCAMLIRPGTKSGTSRTRVANSSITSRRRGSGAIDGSTERFAWYSG